MYKQLGVIGCGLMGGSFALALKQAGLVQQVLGFSKSSATAQSALQLGVIDRVAQSLQEVVTGSDLVLLAVPVSATEATLREVRDRLAPGVLLMDVGSTKCDVIAAAQRALGERMASFVPAHPIAGKESAGVAHAEASLYQGRQLILTPLPQTDGALLQQARELWSAICRICWPSPISSRLPIRPKAANSCRWPGPAFATSPALPPATPMSGATSC